MTESSRVPNRAGRMTHPVFALTIGTNITLKLHKGCR